LACGAAGRRCPTSREAPFLKLTAIGAGAKQSGQRESLVLVVVLVLDHLADGKLFCADGRPVPNPS